MGRKNDLILRLVEQDLAREQLTGASVHTLKGLRAGRRGGPTRLPKRRIQLAISQGWRCHWCQQSCREDVGWMNTATLEHVVPQCQGGPNEPWNLVMACHRCNCLRDTQGWEDFEVLARELPADLRTLAEARVVNKRLARQRRAQRHRDIQPSNRPPLLDRMLMFLGTWARAVPA